MGKLRFSGCVVGILLVVMVLAGCAVSMAGDGGAGTSRGAGGVRPGDTNVTNLVADGDVTVGGDLTVAGECVGCGGGVGYVSYVAHLSRVDTGNPVAVVLTNELSGPVVWTREDAGVYWGTLAGAFSSWSHGGFFGGAR